MRCPPSFFFSLRHSQEAAAAPRKGGITPASFGAPRDDGAPIPKAKNLKAIDPKAIWTEEDLVDELDEDDDEEDGRANPQATTDWSRHCIRLTECV